MPRIVTIIDTNLYRGVSDTAIEDLRLLESRTNVQPMASFHATTELLSHLCSVTDFSFGASRAALRRLWEHCAVYSLTDSALHFAADPNGMLATTLFNRRVEWGDELAVKTSSIVKRVALRGASDLPHELSRDLTTIQQFRDDGEARFVGALAEIRRQLGLDETIESDFASSERPTPDEFLRSGVVRWLCAYALVMNCASDLRLELSEDELSQRATMLEAHIPTALAVFESAVAKVVSVGASPNKQSNSYWDFQLALFAAESMRVGGRPVIIVTEDKPVHRAAKATGAGDRVLSLSDYRTFLLNRLVT